MQKNPLSNVKHMIIFSTSESYSKIHTNDLWPKFFPKQLKKMSMVF